MPTVLFIYLLTHDKHTRRHTNVHANLYEGTFILQLLILSTVVDGVISAKVLLFFVCIVCISERYRATNAHVFIKDQSIKQS